MPQLEIWALPGQPLQEKDWKDYGYKSLEDYVVKLTLDHTGHQKKACKYCLKYKNLDLVSFGTFDPDTGAKDVKMLCKTVEDLPKETIPDVVIFN